MVINKSLSFMIFLKINRHVFFYSLYVCFLEGSSSRSKIFPEGDSVCSVVVFQRLFDYYHRSGGMVWNDRQ